MQPNARRECSTCTADIEVARNSKAHRAEVWDCYACQTAKRQGASADYLRIVRDIQQSKRTRAQALDAEAND